MKTEPQSSLFTVRVSAARILLLFILSSLAAQAQTVPALVNYQGRLANPDGSPLPTADYTLTFKVFDAATNGALVWGPQVFDGAVAQGHGARIPVVQGYFNVMLGPVDTNGASLADAFNGNSRYVEVTVSNRPPIAPRQQILTTPFAFQAANSTKLAGYDWSAVFGTNDPVNGKMSGSRIANGTITSQQMIGSGSGLTNLNAASLTSGTIPDGRLSGNYFTAVTFNNGANNFFGNSVFASSFSGSGAGLTALNGTNISDGTIAYTKLSARQVGTNVGVGGVAVSQSTGRPWHSPTPTISTAVTNLSVVLQTTGRPIAVFLTSSQTNDLTSTGTIQPARVSGVGGNVYVQLFRDGTLISAQYAVDNGSAVGNFTPGSFNFFDTAAAAGLHSYEIRTYMTGPENYLDFYEVRLVAFEL